MLAAVVFVALAVAPSAFAQATRTWVSGVGDDANPCSRTAPCKTWAGAISKTAAGGEIDALDPGGYGAITITKAITLVGTGTNASILSAGTTGVVVNAGAADVVTLRNISINGAGTGINGIRFINGKALMLQNVDIQQISGPGVRFEGTGKLVMNGSSVQRSGAGVRIDPTSGGVVRATITNSLFADNGSGIISFGALTRLSVRNVVLSGNSSFGLWGSNSSQTTIESSVVENSNIGIRAQSSAVIRVSNCDVVDNATGLFADTGGQILSRLNNNLFNDVNGSFTGTYGSS